MKNIITLAVSLFSLTIFAQVGINNNTPKATLDITAQTTNGSKPEGLLPPRLTGDQIQAGDAQYTAAQAGIIIYATAAATAPSTKTANITAAGYYFYDGTAWQKLTSGAAVADATTTAKGIVQLAGDLSGTAASPAIAANAVTSAKILDGTVANADLATGTGGIYKGSGSLSGNTTVTQGANTLAFTSTATNGFSVDGTTLSVDAANDRVGIGTSAPNATLDVTAQTIDGSKPEGFIAPRLTGDQIKAGDLQYGVAQTGAIVYATSAVSTASTKTVNIDSQGYYIFDGSIWTKLLSQAQNIPTQILSVSVPGTQNIRGGTLLTAQFTIENLDTYNAWSSNIFTVPLNKGGAYTINTQIVNSHTPGEPSVWYTQMNIEKSIDGGSSWTNLTKDTRSGLSSGDVDNGNILFWSGLLNAGDKVRVTTICNATLNNIVARGSLVMTKL